jgi:predicted nuclease with TOPRIM domain
MPRASNTVTKELAEFRAAMQSGFAQQSARIDHLSLTLTGEIRAVAVAVETVAVHLNRTNAKVDALTEQVHENGVRFEQFQSSVDARFEWVISSTNRLSGETNRLSGETNRLSGEVAELRSRFDRHDVASLDRRVTTLEKKLARR